MLLQHELAPVIGVRRTEEEGRGDVRTHGMVVRHDRIVDVRSIRHADVISIENGPVNAMRQCDVVERGVPPQSVQYDRSELLRHVGIPLHLEVVLNLARDQPRARPAVLVRILGQLAHHGVDLILLQHPRNHQQHARIALDNG